MTRLVGSEMCIRDSFRAGFDFLRLRAEVAEIEVALADWWQEFSVADDAAREDLIQQAKSDKSQSPNTAGPKARRAPRRRKPANKVAGAASSDGAASAD
jgi:poly(A) polymerase